ncbi:lytic transglycosylase domain-containing protein [Pseudoxanthomonas daejeonensis]|uniref:Lytic transglycosylase n=1 Tax=Pseudoxanthomonas daejeonensis TaxID=266062 RepID=A0ABQ6Z8T0_9GAMM|nr:lytic transglycosylase domain-containing protein [Pseudoxanthomonas daejeonensis]KAF1695886.1 lytic transglycosylase [Pseudoxanthomonas daejeonensis]
MFPRFPKYWPLAALLLVCASPSALAQRVSAKDKVAADVLVQRMATAEQRYNNALVLAANGDAKGVTESNAALEDMEDVVDACVKQRGCPMSDLLATWKRLLKAEIDTAGEELDEDPGEEALLEADTALAADIPEAARAARLLGDDNRHAFDRMVKFNPAIQAGIRRWLTDMRPQLMDSYENYQVMRHLMWPEFERRGLPEALLFGIMAKESNGRVHAVSRAGAAGPMQFMPATGRRFGLGPDDSGFDSRYDPRSAAMASAAYLNERLRQLNNDMELSLAGYNGGEGRALRVHRQSGGTGFWDASVYGQFPAETRDYVPMVIAAAWIYLHPRQYGVSFPKVDAHPATFKLARPASIYELTICLGNHGNRDGYMRTLRNLNPRYEAESWIPAGTTLNATTRVAGLYARHCSGGARTDLARALVTADVNAAIVSDTRSGNVAVGEVVPLPGDAAFVPAPVPAAKPKARTHRVAKGDTLGRIAQRYGCEVKTLARANGLKAPGYSVRQGQQIRLEGCSR